MTGLDNVFMTRTEAYWDSIYSTNAPNQLSWFRPHLETSLSFIETAAPNRESRVIDIGGGESTLVDDLLARGYAKISTLDISSIALEATKQRLGVVADGVEWMAGDITTIDLPSTIYDVWHDRAVFHFLTEPTQRTAYVEKVRKSVKPGGHVIIGTFGTEGPTKCSGLSVQRYSAESLHEEFGRRFRLIDSIHEMHETPFGTTQQFLYCFCVVE